MRVLIVSEGYGREFFGVSQVLLQLTGYLAQHGVEYEVIAAQAGDLLPEQKQRVTQLPMYAHALKSNPLAHLFRWHPQMRSCILKRIKDFKPDVMHVHGAMTPIQLTAIRLAVQEGVPVILSPHGMLEPWLWSQKGALFGAMKRSYWNTFFKPVIKKVNCLHSITPLEQKNLEVDFPGTPQILISNGIAQSVMDRQAVNAADLDRSFLFVGRLHPKKGVDLLIQAFSQCELEEDWQLKIVGPDFDPVYGAYLRQLVLRLHMEHRILFLGPMYGDEKMDLLARAWAAVFPSHSEVVGLVNLEAAAASTPSITTRATGLHDWEESGGLLIDPDPEQLTRALTVAAAWTVEERLRLGAQARKFVQEKYSWNVIGGEWVKAYQLLGESKDVFYNS